MLSSWVSEQPRIKLTPQSNDGVPLQNTLTDAYAHHYRKEQCQLLRRRASQDQKHRTFPSTKSMPLLPHCHWLHSAPFSVPVRVGAQVLLGGLGGHSHRADSRSCLKPFSTRLHVPTYAARLVSHLHSFPGTWIPPRQLSPLLILHLSPKQANL